MKKIAAFIIVFFTALSQAQYAHADDQNYGELTIQYNGYKKVSDNAIVLDVVFIQPDNQVKYNVHSDLKLSISTKGGIYYSPISLIDNGTGSYSPYAIVYCFDEELVQISISGEIICDAFPETIISLDTVLYDKTNKNHVQTNAKITATGSVSEVVTLVKDKNIFSNDRLKNGILAPGRNDISNLLFTVFRWLMLVYFGYWIYKMQFGHTKIILIAENFFHYPTEKDAKKLIKLLHNELHDTEFILSFRKKFESNFYSYSHAINYAALKTQTKRDLKRVLYASMFKPIEKDSFIDSQKGFCTTENKPQNT